jgi:hypothetical protein
VPVTSGSAVRMYVESSALIQSGIAVANVSSSPATVTFSLTQPDGSSVPGIGPASATVAGSGQITRFLAELFPALPNAFRGVLRIATSSSAISVVGLRSRYNERGDFLITTTPSVNENTSPSSSEMIFPHFADGGGYTTQFILFSGTAGQVSWGDMRAYDSNGQPLDLSLR